MQDPFHRPVFSPAVYYRDPLAALAWLERAFGFARSLYITDREGRFGHAEMRCGSGVLMIGGEWAQHTASPAGLDGKNTQSVHVLLEQDLDAHCTHARAAGAIIVQEPTDQFWGDRNYRARDPEGHDWTFCRVVRRVTREGAERDSGLRIEGWWPHT
ncbi:MAG: VOC family protein [Betaproteobacteria bacterium]|nr:VOC family protein [Betaproteobacteria bacterium]MDE2124311.1 VOC family protein [Betaproteobacteria bacterium]MDE2186222.1 VOC family protein [Betaproteobacteria bacterium]MDE2326106.1 VOC family protein [Betaproteobacteria bacterium]